MMSDDNTPRWTGLRRFLGRMSGRRRSQQHTPKHTGTQESRDNLDASCPTRHHYDMGGGLMTVTTVLLVTAACLLGMCSPAAACSSRATPRPRPPAPTQRPNVTFHTYVCPPAYATWYCLNGATCFTVKIGESLLYNCECADGYMGPRCEYKDLDGSYLPSQRRFMLETASIASGATIAALLVVVLCAVAYVHYRRRAKEAEMNAADAEPPPAHHPASQDSVDGLVGPPVRPLAAAARSSHHRQPTFGSRAPSWKRPHHHQQQQLLVQAHHQTVTLLPQPQSTDTSMAVGP